MDVFDVKRRDYPEVKKFSDMKAKPFGGPKEAIPFDANGKKDKLANYQRVVDRNPDFEGGNFRHNYDSTWKAVTRDLVSRAANKKPFNPMYAKPTVATTKAVEEGRIARFEEFINENSGFNMFAEAEADDMNTDKIPGTEDEPIMDAEPEVDEEKLASLMEDYSETITDVIEEIMKQMEIEREETIDLLRAALSKMKDEPADEDSKDKEDESDEDEDETDEDLTFGSGSGPKEEE